MECREECGACCIAASISSPLPGMPFGKAAGVYCVNLTANMRCAIYNSPEFPDVCRAFRPDIQFCGRSRDEAVMILGELSGLKGH